VSDEESALVRQGFDSARQHLKAAREARGRLLRLWNDLPDHEVFEIRIDTQPDGAGELWASAWLPEDVAGLLQTCAQGILVSVKAAMDSAVWAAAQTVCNPICPVDPELHRMPLCRSRAEFDGLFAQGLLLGLRPDQVRTLQDLQPYQRGEKSRNLIGRTMLHLAEGLAAAERREELMCAWATNSAPKWYPPPGARLEFMEAETGGPLATPLRLARFRVSPPEAVTKVRVRPCVGFDPVLKVPPWSMNPDDNASARTRAMLVIAQHLIDGLERSVSAPELAQRYGGLGTLAPTGGDSLWTPVQFSSPQQDAEARAELGRSDLGLATYRDEAGVFALLRLDSDVLVAREIPEASPLPRCEVNDLGRAAEESSLAAPAALGLPDFVFRAKIVRKGSGLREVGDGTLVSGGRGIALQVKARASATSNHERESKWLLKKAAEGLRQAHGTIRFVFMEPQLSLVNLRERTVSLRGDAIDWVPVVVLDHPSPPDRVAPNWGDGLRGLVLLRRDWEFLWRQLRSVAAVVDYVHRVAGSEPAALGRETERYFDLADKDARAHSEPLAPWMLETGPIMQVSDPRLPSEPPDSRDSFGHEVFSMVLEDIAASDLSGDEETRLEVLAEIDRLPVAARAELGRTLMGRLDACALAQPDSLRAEHRIVLLDGGNLQLMFSVYSQLSGYHKELHKTWLLVRRQEYLRASLAEGPDYPWSVGVLLTPRFDGGRYWDTTVFATDGGPAFSQADYETLAHEFKQHTE
jgi:hypothetical protein